MISESQEINIPLLCNVSVGSALLYLILFGLVIKVVKKIEDDDPKKTYSYYGSHVSFIHSIFTISLGIK